MTFCNMYFYHVRHVSDNLTLIDEKYKSEHCLAHTGGVSNYFKSPGPSLTTLLGSLLYKSK